jgi:hypothetical protein
VYFAVKVAVTAVAEPTTHVLVPEQPPPDQPAKTEPVDAVAVNVTLVPLANACEQVEPHETPAGELVTVPDPLPASDTLSVKEGDIVPTTA